MRVCNVCNSYFSQGYINESNYDYYCSDECLNKEVTPEERKQLQADPEELELYYTEWTIKDIDSYDLIDYLYNELQDSVSFMELFDKEELGEDDRLTRKQHLLSIIDKWHKLK